MLGDLSERNKYLCYVWYCPTRHPSLACRYASRRYNLRRRGPYVVHISAVASELRLEAGASVSAWSCCTLLPPPELNRLGFIHWWLSHRSMQRVCNTLPESTTQRVVSVCALPQTSLLPGTSPARWAVISLVGLLNIGVVLRSPLWSASVGCHARRCHDH